MEATEGDCYTDSLYGLRFIDRRKKTLPNRFRRFINSYWLVPTFILYLELFAIILPPVDSPVKNLKERNLYLFQGPAVLYRLVSTDFPHVLIGHFNEIYIVKKYALNIGQVPSEDIAIALKDRDSTRKIYRRILESRDYYNTEIGGIATLLYTPEGPKLRLYEITSMNKTLSERLHEVEDSSVEEFISLIKRKENRELITKVGIDETMINNMIAVLLSDRPDQNQKMTLIKDFIRTYDIHSESKYILSPYDFKSFLGSKGMEGKYIGLFHFHNNYMEPPSEIDIGNSDADRQIVVTLGDRGIVIYDIIKGKEIIYRGDLIS